MGKSRQKYINLGEFLPSPDKNGYRNFTIYNSLYINIFSEEKTNSTFLVTLNCQERNPDSKSSSTVSYISYFVTINFKDGKNLKSHLQIFLIIILQI